MFAFLYLAFKRTRVGLVIQAALTHPQMVERARPRRAARLRAGVRRRQRARGPRRRDRRLHLADRAQHGGGARADRLRGRRRGRAGLDSRRLHRVDADRYRADLRGRARLLAARPVRGRSASRVAGTRRCTTSTPIKHRAGRADHPLPAPGADADRCGRAGCSARARHELNRRERGRPRRRARDSARACRCRGSSRRVLLLLPPFRGCRAISRARC